MTCDQQHRRIRSLTIFVSYLGVKGDLGGKNPLYPSSRRIRIKVMEIQNSDIVRLYSDYRKYIANEKILTKFYLTKDMEYETID